MDNKNSILLIDPSFEPTNAAECYLLIKIGLKSFSYAIINAKTKKVTAVFNQQECDNTAKKFAERLKNDNYLTLPYQDIKVALHSANAISIPQVLFHEANLGANTVYFTENHTANLYVDVQNHFGFNSIFSLPKNTEDILNLQNAKFFLENAGLLNQAEHLNGPSFILDFAVGSVNAIYLNQNQVIFQQNYEIDDVEEFNYYLLLMMNQLNMEKNTIVYVCGVIHENDANYNCLHKYFSSIEFLTVDNNLDQEVLDDMPAHYYSSLLALNQCV